MRLVSSTGRTEASANTARRRVASRPRSRPDAPEVFTLVARGEADIGAVTRENDVVLAYLGCEGRNRRPVLAHAVEIVLAVDRDQIAILAHLPLALESREVEIL